VAAYGFFAENEPILFQHDAQCGTIADVFWHFGALEIGWETADDLRAIVAREPDTSRPLAEQIMPILRQFSSGEYALRFGDLPEDHALLPWDGRSGKSDEVYTGWDTLYLLATQPDSTLDRGRIDEFKVRIEGGERPWAITLVMGDYSELILDGHHKLAAYGELMEPALRLAIHSATTAELTLDDFPSARLGYLPHGWFELFLERERSRSQREKRDEAVLRETVRWTTRR
jgi:hypothetical protein